MDYIFLEIEKKWQAWWAANKTYKAVTGTFTIDGSIDTPDGQPSVVLYVSGEEESDYTMYRFSGELKVCRTVIYESDWQLFRHDIIINKDEVLENLNHFFRELRIMNSSPPQRPKP